MKISKLKIENLYGIEQLELDGKSIELTGTNGAGKSSVLDAIRLALTNNSKRKYRRSPRAREDTRVYMRPYKKDGGLYVRNHRALGVLDQVPV